MKLNGTVKWAKVFEPDTRYNPKWSIDLYPADEVLVKLKKAGFALKEDKEGQMFIHIKRNVTRKDGTPNDQPRVVGPDGKTPWNTSNLIGNGSVVNVLTSDYEYGGKRYLGLNAVQVVDHVPYGEDHFDDLTGTDREMSKDEF